MFQATARRSAALAATLMATGLALTTATTPAAASPPPAATIATAATPPTAGTTPVAGTTAVAAFLTTGSDRPAIIGGRTATETYPFMVSFRLPQEPDHHCGGALVAADWVVTAAHCKGLLKPGGTRVRVGSLDRDEGGVPAGVKRVVVHPDFGSRRERRGVEADIALVRLDRRVDLTPIPIAGDAGDVGEPSRVLGWGMTCEDREDPACADGPRVLRELDTVRVADDRCVTLDGVAELCAGERDGRAASACNGDSGGPQIRRVGDRWELIGATSRDGDDVDDRMDGAAGCSTNPSGGPGVGIWTDVTHYRSWIARILGEEAPAEVRSAS
ncbi:S1 family peptidase [Nonomuraea muscovyensis]